MAQDWGSPPPRVNLETFDRNLPRHDADPRFLVDLEAELYYGEGLTLSGEVVRSAGGLGEALALTALNPSLEVLLAMPYDPARHRFAIRIIDVMLDREAPADA